MKTMNDPAKDAYFEPACYASRIAALISEHQSKDERPDWWQQVVAQLHSQLDKQFPPFEDEFEELAIPQAPCNPPFEEQSLGILKEISYEQGCHDDRLNSLEKSIAAIEDWADIKYLPREQGEYMANTCIHELIADGMTGVTTHCMESAAALVTVAAAATDKRLDAVAKQAELLQSLVLNVKELLLNVDSRLDALESKTPR